MLARRIALLSPLYETVAQAALPQSRDEAFHFAIARGQLASPPPGADLTAQAVAAAFAQTPPAHRYAWFIANDRLGEAILRATLVLSNTARDPGDITDALLLLRAVGLEDLARRAALQLLLLDPATGL
jgi:hypothetical protein